MRRFIFLFLFFISLFLFAEPFIPIQENEWDKYTTLSEDGLVYYEVYTDISNDRDSKFNLYCLHIESTNLLNEDCIYLSLVFNNARDYIKFANSIDLLNIHNEIERLIILLDNDGILYAYTKDKEGNVHYRSYICYFDNEKFYNVYDSLKNIHWTNY